MESPCVDLQKYCTLILQCSAAALVIPAVAALHGMYDIPDARWTKWFTAVVWHRQSSSSSSESTMSTTAVYQEHLLAYPTP